MSGKTVKDVVKDMGFTNYAHLYYYYPQERIKKPTLEKFCSVLSITIDDFYNGELIKSGPDGAGVSFHQGKNLQSAITNQPITDTAFAEKMGLSRKTLYTYYKQAQIKEDIITKAAKILKIPIAQLKGIDVHEWTINDVYFLLKVINGRLDKIESGLQTKK